MCIAETPCSLADDPALPNAPQGFRLAVRAARLLAGAGFVVAFTGEIITMPGLARVPAAERIGVGADGRFTGLSRSLPPSGGRPPARGGILPLHGGRGTRMIGGSDGHDG